MTNENIYAFLNSNLNVLQEKLLEDLSLNEISKFFGVSTSFLKTKISVHKLKRHPSRTRTSNIYRKYNKEYCLSIANSCLTKEEFKYNYPGEYVWLRNHNLIDTVDFKGKSKYKNFPEFVLRELMTILFPSNNIRFNDRRLIYPLELDVIDYDQMIGIEYDGENFHKNNENDSKKDKKCEELNIKLIRIKEISKKKDKQIKNIFDNLEKYFDLSKINIEQFTREIIIKFYSASIDYNSCIEKMKQYSSLYEFRSKYRKEYDFLYKFYKNEFKFFDDFSYEMTEDEIIEILSKFKTKAEFREHGGRAYSQIYDNKSKYPNALIKYNELSGRTMDKFNTIKKIPIWFLDMKTEVLLNGPTLVEYLEQGWSMSVTKERRTFNVRKANIERHQLKLLR